MAKAALLACIFVYVLLHLIVKSGPAFLELCQFVLPDVFSHLLIEVNLFVITSQLFGGYGACKHLLLGFF